MQRPFLRRLSASTLNLISPPVGHYFIGAPVSGLVLAALVPASVAWLVYSVYAGAEAPRIQVGFGLVVAAWVALIVHPWFIAPGKRPAAWRVVVAFSVATTGWVMLSPVTREWIEVFRIPSNSMYPGLEEGDHFVTLKRPWQVSRGDAVVFDAANGEAFVNRVVALGGDRVSISERGTLTVNGERIAPEPSTEPCVFSSYEGDEPCERYWETLGQTKYEVSRSLRFSAQEHPTTLVPEGTVFLLGDNRENSHDSRHIGPVPIEQLRGRVGPVVWWR